jgi:hypothetical protein
MGIRAIVSKHWQVRGALALRIGAVGLVSVGGAGVAQAAWQFDPHVSAEATYTDNIHLDAEDIAQSETVLHLAPGFKLDGGTQRFHATVNYELGGYFYEKSNDSNETVNTLDAVATGEILPELFFFDFLGRAGRTVVDPTEPIATGDYYTGANFTDVALWRATPRFTHQFGSDVKAQLAYEYGRIYYLEDLAGGIALPDLTTRDARLNVDREAEAGGFGWHAKYNRYEAIYSGIEPAVYATAEASAEIPLGRRFWVIAVGGSETDLRRDITSGSLNAAYWEGGLRWQATANQQLRVTTGRRFYGSSYDLAYSLSGRRIKAGLTYTEAPAAQGIELYVNQIFAAAPDQPLPGYTPQDHEIYLRKSAAGWVTLTGARNEVTLELLDDRRDYVVTTGSEHVLRGTLGWGYQLGPRTQVHAGAAWIQLRYRSEERTDDLLNVGVGVSRRLGRLLEITADYRYWKRDVNDPLGAAAGVGFTENAFTIGLKYGR